jgi:hypothetical protein
MWGSRSSTELQSHSLQQVELEVVSGSIASRGASEILKRLRIMQGRGRGKWNAWIPGEVYWIPESTQENKLKACSIVKEVLIYQYKESSCESP